MTGVILGAGFSYALHRKRDKETLSRTVLGTSAKSAMLGALSSASGYFTAGAFLGFTAMQIGKIMAANAQRSRCCVAPVHHLLLNSSSKRSPRTSFLGSIGIRLLFSLKRACPFSIPRHIWKWNRGFDSFSKKKGATDSFPSGKRKGLFYNLHPPSS